MIKAILFDLDGTLLPLNEDEFIKTYFGLLANKMEDYGYDKKKLIDTIWAGTKAMYSNDGKITNEEAFWNVFFKTFGEDKKSDLKYFDEFYRNDFKKTIIATKPNPYAKEIVEFAKNNVDYVILATNPLFPKLATLTRMGFVNLKEDDFNFITTYENFGLSKPKPNYLLEILKRFNLQSDEVIMFGNNDVEDYLCCKKANIKCYLVGDYIIKHDDISGYETIKMDEIIPTIKKEILKF